MYRYDSRSGEMCWLDEAATSDFLFSDGVSYNKNTVLLFLWIAKTSERLQ